MSKYRYARCGNIFERNSSYFNHLKEVFNPHILRDPAPSIGNLIPKKRCPKCGSTEVTNYKEDVTL